jgi:hypothetical protein
MASRISPHSYVWTRTPFGDHAEACSASVKVHAQSLGWNRRAEFRVPILPYEVRASLEPALPDRRGLKRKLNTQLRK